jgi:hypothetical protein
MRNRSKKIAKLGEFKRRSRSRSATLEFGLNKAQQLPLTHRAFVVLSGALNCEFGHV